MVKANQRESTMTEKKFYTGLATVNLKAINPSRAELNKVLGKEDDEDDTDIVYLGEDKEGHDRIRMSLWLYEKTLDKYFVHSFNIANKLRISKDGFKAQLINSTLDTTWVPFKLAENGEVTDELDMTLAPEWFSNFQKEDPETKKKVNIGPKVVRQALLGEEELGKFMRAWLGKWSWNDPNGNALVTMEKLFKEDYSELRELIGSGYDTPFVVLTGVRTDQNDDTKQYQQVFGKAFLPNGFVDLVSTNFRSASDYNKRIWSSFEKATKGDYGFDSYHELVPLKEYDRTKDVSASGVTKKDITPVNSKF